MKMNVEFYHCNVCKNTVGLITNGGGTLVCCGQPMEHLVANTSDGAAEKHVPVVTKEGGKIVVNVGSAAHPMIPEHYIEWIAFVNDKETIRVSLKPGDEPKATFCDSGKGEVFAYCNLHGLWKAEVN